MCVYPQWQLVSAMAVGVGTMDLMARRCLTASVLAASLTAGHDYEPPGRRQGSEQGEHSRIPSGPCVWTEDM